MSTTTPSGAELGLVLVTAATGKTGRRVTERLERLGHRVRPVSRATSPTLDWEDPTTWNAALTGVDAVYLAFAPDAGLPGAAETIERFARTAVQLGTRRIVLLSGRGESGALHSEEAVVRSGAEWAVVRASFFAQNFSEDFLLHAVGAGEVAFPAGDDVVEPFVDLEDLADVAVAALTAPGSGGVVHEITGPRSLSFRRATEEIAAALGRPVTYRETSGEEFAAHLVAGGLPPDAAEGLVGLFAEVLDGRNARPTDEVTRVLGRPASDFADFAEAAARAGAWSAAPSARR
jgi:uncharacterized protein YbjT (DUF2867 family)